MKIIRTYIILLGLTVFVTNAQQANLSPDLMSFPVSPEAAKMAIYGNMPVNLFSGQLNNTIELFTGKVGDYTLPINLRYSYAGNRPEEVPSIIGLGWQLSIGGVVTREVRGLPDEHPNGYYNSTVQNILNTYFNNSTMLFANALKFSNGNYDSQIDCYHVSVNGINFSFKIGVDGTPVYLSKHNYKIEINRDVGNSNKVESFVLTDMNSNKYLFSEKEINEPYSGYGSYFDENFMSYTSSWQLSKITVNNGQEINFGYTVNDFLSYNFYSNLLFRLLPATDLQSLGLERASYSEGCTIFNIKRKVLTTVNSDNFKLNLTYSKINNHEVYNTIVINDLNNATKYSYGFSYSGWRNFLDSITKNNQFFYEFEYSGGTFSVPIYTNSATSYPRNQDEWGFANGANNAYSLSCAYGPLSTPYNADRTPSFTHTVKGALSSIHYPTGGTTTISYEQNSMNQIGSNGDPNTRISLKFKSDNNPSAPLSKEKVFTKTFDRSVEAVLSHYISNINFIDISIKRIDITDSPIGAIPYFDRIPSERISTSVQKPLVPVHLYEQAQVDSNCANFNNCAKSKNSGGLFFLPAGTYEFRIKTDYNRTQDVNASITLDFYDYEVDIFTQQGTPMVFGGIRVKNTVDIPSNGGTPIVKNYDYVNGRRLDDPFLIHENYIKEIFTANAIEPYRIPYQPTAVNISAKALNLVLKSSIPVCYTDVIEYTNRTETYVPQPFFCTNCGGNFGGNWDSTPVYSYLNGVYVTKKNVYPEGYKQTSYNSPRLSYTNFPYIPLGTDLSLGVVKSNIVYSKNTISTTNNKLLEEENSYFHHKLWEYLTLYPDLNYPRSMNIDYKVKILGTQQLPSYLTIDDFFHFKLYKELDSQSFVNNKNTKEYFGTQFIEKNMQIEYDTHFQQHLVTTSDSNNNVLTNEIFHPYDFSDSVSLNMVSKNCISPIMKVVNKENGNVIDSYKYVFGSIVGNLFKPLSFWKSKGMNALEKRMEYSYDYNGNITQVKTIASDAQSSPPTLSKGPTKTVIWGYKKSHPVAVIENGDTVNIPASLISAVQNLTDSSSATEAQILAALTNLRSDNSLTGSMVTTYTYKPLIGISTITDPKGDIQTFTYDSQGRLQSVKDKNGNILTENDYHYKY